MQSFFSTTPKMPDMVCSFRLGSRLNGPIFGLCHEKNAASLDRTKLPTSQTIPDGAADAKATSASMISYVSDLGGVLDLNSDHRSFWMKFGSAKINDKPFIWSESQWSSQKLRDVPDSIDGEFNYLGMFIR